MLVYLVLLTSVSMPLQVGLSENITLRVAMKLERRVTYICQDSLCAHCSTVDYDLERFNGEPASPTRFHTLLLMTTCRRQACSFSFAEASLINSGAPMAAKM